MGVYVMNTLTITLKCIFYLFLMSKSISFKRETTKRSIHVIISVKVAECGIEYGMSREDDV